MEGRDGCVHDELVLVHEWGSCEHLQQEVAAWQEQRNQAQAIINWRFTTADARIKRKRLYPSIEE